jgi:formiminotetrahydrofolate cyclodeaminase
MGAGLLAMVAGIAYRKQKDPAARQKLGGAAVEAQKLKEKLLELSLRDEAAYNDAVSAHALPSKTEAERTARGAEIARALGRCIDVPVEVMQACLGALELFKPIIGFCPAAVASDFAGALNCLRGCAYTAGAVVLINLRESALLPADYVEKVKAELKRTGEAVDELCGLLDAELGKMLIA